MLENVRSHVGAAVLHWHSKGIEVAGLTVGGAVAIATIAFSRDHTDAVLNYSLAALIVILGFFGSLTTHYIRMQFYQQVGILKEIDLRTGTLCRGHFGGERALYPKDLEDSGTEDYKEPLMEYARVVVPVANIVLALIVALVTWYAI
jgi:hypothetical protein